MKSMQRLFVILVPLALAVQMLLVSPVNADEKFTGAKLWRAPVCWWRSYDIRCVLLAEVVAAYPFRAKKMSAELVSLLTKYYQHMNLPVDNILAKLGNRGILLACPKRQGRTEAITLGTINYSVEWEEQCKGSAKDKTPTLTSAVRDFGSRKQSELTTYDRAFNAYLEECEEQQAATSVGQPRPTEDAESDRQKRLKKKKKEEEEKLKKKKEEAAKKKKALEEAKKREKEAREAMENDPSNPNKQQAFIDAADDRAKNEEASAKADQDVINAEEDLAETEKWLAEQKAWDDRTQRLYDFDDGLKEWGLKHLNIGKKIRAIRDLAELVRKLFGGSGDCIAAECPAQSCREEAQVRALRDLLKMYDKPPCNELAIPAPGNEGKCYSTGRLDGSPLSSAEVSALASAWCEEKKKFVAGSASSTCARVMTFRASETPFVHDPCTGPEVMCAPEIGPSWQYPGLSPAPGGDSGTGTGGGSGGTTPE